MPHFGHCPTPTTKSQVGGPLVVGLAKVGVRPGAVILPGREIYSLADDRGVKNALEVIGTEHGIRAWRHNFFERALARLT